MREIKFRAWNKREYKMQFVSGLCFDEKCVLLASCKDGKRDYNQMPDWLELMQYTSLKDKNGKEIYEGDIVRILGFKNSPVLFRVIYQAPEFRLKRIDEGKDRYLNLLENTEVIGNIYENPELLVNKKL